MILSSALAFLIGFSAVCTATQSEGADEVSNGVLREARMKNMALRRMSQIARQASKHHKKHQSSQNSPYSIVQSYDKELVQEILDARFAPDAIPSIGHYGPATGIDFDISTDLTFNAFEHSFFSGFAPFDDYDFRQYWLQMIYDVNQLIMDEEILREEPFLEKVLKLIFHLIEQIPILKSKEDADEPCPYSFDRVGHDMCLSSEFPSSDDSGNGVGVTWQDARDYCVLKGGDLAIVRDIKDLEDIFMYLIMIADPQMIYSYWLGASVATPDTDLAYLDGTPLRTTPSFVVEGFTIPTGVDLAAYLDVAESWYISVIDPVSTDSSSAQLLPLCQYIKARDGHLTTMDKPTGVGPFGAWFPVRDAVQTISDVIALEKSTDRPDGIDVGKNNLKDTIPFTSGAISG